MNKLPQKFSAMDRELQARGNLLDADESVVTQPTCHDKLDRYLKTLKADSAQHPQSTSFEVACEESIRALVAAVEAKDPFTRRHSATVSKYTQSLAERLNLPARQIGVLKNAAILHDVGKIGVPDAILCKPGPLTAQEYEIVKRHPITAIEILGHVSSLKAEMPLILHHHERYDGKGYPQGLSRGNIPFGARLIAITDAVDAMLSRRSYKQPYTVSHVIEELRKATGRQFDPLMTDKTIQWLEGPFSTEFS